MGLFDIFKNKKEQPKQQVAGNENSIEVLLRKAATEPAYRAEFYKHLLSESLIVLTAKTGLPEGEQTLAQNTSVSLLTLQDGKIPVFTSTDRIFDKGIIKEEVPFLKMKGEDLFTFATGAMFVLNPYSDYGKELLPAEIESLLNGTILTSNRKQIEIQKETPVQIGQPANYPTAVVNSLKTLFATKPVVKAAYLGWIYDASSGQPPHLIIALDTEGDMRAITDEAGFTAQEASKPDDIIDFIQIDHSSGISDYFTKQTVPFYVRQ